MNNLKPLGLKIIILLEVLLGVLGIYFFYDGLTKYLGFYRVPEGVTDLAEFKAREGFAGLINIIWSLPYLTLLPAGSGMLMAKEWGKKISLFVIPLVLLFSLPFLALFLGVKIILPLARITGLIKPQATMGLSISSLLTWLIAILAIFFLNRFLKKYLSNIKL